jgi:hypothetical protein
MVYIDLSASRVTLVSLKLTYFFVRAGEAVT